MIAGWFIVEARQQDSGLVDGFDRPNFMTDIGYDAEMLDPVGFQKLARCSYTKLTENPLLSLPQGAKDGFYDQLP